MQYSPKLKMAMEEIKAVLNKYDIAATVVLHTPGFSEYVFKIDPSYSCAKIEGSTLAIRAKLNEDFKGDKEAWTKKVTDTVDMLKGMAEVNNMLMTNTAAALKAISKHVQIEFNLGDHTGHNQQNN